MFCLHSALLLFGVSIFLAGCGGDDGLGMKIACSSEPAAVAWHQKPAAVVQAAGMTIQVLPHDGLNWPDAPQRIATVLAAELKKQPKSVVKGRILQITPERARFRSMEYPARASAEVTIHARLLAADGQRVTKAFVIKQESHSIAIEESKRAQQMAWIQQQTLAALAKAVMDQLQ